MEVRFQRNCPGQFHRESQYPGPEGGERPTRGAERAKNSRKAFLSRFASRQAFGDFNRFNCFLRAGGLLTDGRTEGARKIEETRVEKGGRIREWVLSHCRDVPRERSDFSARTTIRSSCVFFVFLSVRAVPRLGVRDTRT